MKVDFYILEETGKQRAWLFACSLLEKAYLAKQSVYINAATSDDANQLDAFLWTYKEESFLPHQLVETGAHNPPLILIGHSEIKAPSQNILMNFQETVPAFYQQFEHIIEIVAADERIQQAARNRFKYYREQGCQIETHKLKTSVV